MEVSGVSGGLGWRRQYLNKQVMQMNVENLEMSKFRQAIFPIENRELKKFIPFAMLIFITVFNFTQLRNIKDAVVLTAPGSGGEAISYLKTLIVMPSVILMSAFYVRLRKSASFERSYTVIVGFFIAFFIIFNYFLFPNADHLHMSLDTISSLKAAYPRVQFIFPVIGAWTYSLYYLMAEMWGTFVLSVLFWQFANDNIGTHEAKRFYPQFLLVNAVATILVGVAMKAAGGIQMTNNVVIVGGLVMLYIFRYVNTEVLTDPRFTSDVSAKTKKQKVKLSFGESLKQLVASPYIGYLSMMILAYGLSINMIEVCWKDIAVKVYPLKEDYAAMMADYSLYTGLTGVVLVMISKGVLRRYGWLPCAIITPLVISVSGAVYFSTTLFPGVVEPWMLLAGFTSPQIFVFALGMGGVILSKSSKYSFFDPTKEMAYIPLPYDLRMTGKAAADGIGGRLGKAGSGYIQMALFAVTAGSLQDILPYLACILVALSALWIFSVFRLNALYNQALVDAEIED